MQDRCRGCDGELPAPKGTPRNPRQWCSEACRVATHRAERSPLKLYAEDGAAAVSEYRDALKADPCSYCGEPAAHTDHIEPIGAGGGNHWANLTASCQHCNQRKGSRSLLAFLLAKPLLERRDDINAELRLLAAA